MRRAISFSSLVVRVLLLAVVVVAAAGILGCAKAPREAQGMLDTPLHHYETGMRAVDSGDTDAAIRSFNTALELDAAYGPAIAGKGLVLALKGDPKESLALIRTGQKKASDDASPERMWTYVMELRAYIALCRLGKLSNSALLYEGQKAFDNAVEAAPGAALSWFWQGEAYLRALEFDDARIHFREAQKLDQGLGERAGARLQFLEKVNKAALKTSIGKRIALVTKISRADMAALVVEELGVEKFFEGTDVPETSTFATPEAVANAEDVEVLDIQNHPLAADIKVVLQYRLRGLQPYADHTFQPNKPLTRAEAALILEDIYIRAKNDPALATKFVGQESPFPDVRNDHPFFNAVMFATTRGLLSADVAKGTARPLDTVSGVDAVLFIDILKTQLAVF